MSSLSHGLNSVPLIPRFLVTSLPTWRITAPGSRKAILQSLVVNFPALLPAGRVPYSGTRKKLTNFRRVPLIEDLRPQLAMAVAHKLPHHRRHILVETARVQPCLQRGEIVLVAQ